MESLTTGFPTMNHVHSRCVDCIETKGMKDVIERLKDERYNVVHIYGMPGSGKSQIVGCVCQEMVANGHIVWHVQCQHDASELKRSWSELARRLCERRYMSCTSRESMLYALENPDEATMKVFLDVVKQVRTSILLIVELDDEDDVNSRRSLSEEIEILSTYIKSLSSKTENVKLLIASRNDDIIFQKSLWTSLESYTVYHVTGFTEEEATAFLKKVRTGDITDGLADLAIELAYSPWGLFLAKSYCSEFNVSYGVYSSSLGQDDGITEKEKEMLRMYPDLRKNHRYGIIMNLLREKNSEDDVEFRVMQTLSFLNKNNIPRQIIEALFSHKYRSARPAKVATDHLIRKLEKRVGCVWDRATDIELISVHGDIFRALRSSIDTDEKASVLSLLLQTMTPMGDKDIRFLKEYEVLRVIKPHILEVAFRYESKSQFPESKDSLGMEEHEIYLSLSRINEMVGFAVSYYSAASENNEEDWWFEKAKTYLWKAVTMNYRSSKLGKIRRMLRGKRVENPTSLPEYEYCKDPEESAKMIYKVSVEAAKQNPILEQALKNDYFRTFPLNLNHVEHMKARPGQCVSIEWDDIERCLKENHQISGAQLSQLEREKFVLDWESMSKYYIAERLASILHSRGRQSNYRRYLNSNMIKKCNWWVDVGIHLCDIASEKSGFHSIFKFLLRANNKIYKQIAQMGDGSNDEFKKRFDEMRQEANSFRYGKPSLTYHEHGKFKVVEGTSWTVMNALKCLVIANTKIHKRPAVSGDETIKAGLEKFDKEAEELYDTAVKHREITMSPVCLVCVGKYFAARLKFEEAFDAFDKAADMGMGTYYTSGTTYAWALFNVMRAIYKADGKYRTEIRMKKIGDLYEKTRDNGTPETWTYKLSEMGKNIGLPAALTL